MNLTLENNFEAVALLRLIYTVPGFDGRAYSPSAELTVLRQAGLVECKYYEEPRSVGKTTVTRKGVAFLTNIGFDKHGYEPSQNTGDFQIKHNDAFLARLETFTGSYIR